MKIGILFVVCLLFPMVTYAHETRMYLIDAVPYEIIVGSVGEPVVVDDKTAVSVEVVRDGNYLEGVEEYLKVELIAGAVKRVQELTPLYGNQGIYRSKYIATAPTQITYRLFGTLEGEPVDLQFSCNPIGHQHTEKDMTRVAFSDKVIQISKEGMFSCPEAKEALGFPLLSKSIATLDNGVDTVLHSKDGNNISDRFVHAVVIALFISVLYLFWYTHSRKNKRKE